MARTIIRDAVRLEALAGELAALQRALDNEENVPERYASTLAGELADADSERLTHAEHVVRRLGRWARHERWTPERYTRKPEPAPTEVA